jgi:hypothetical protein
MMIDQFFSNVDYYKNEEFQTLMRNYNYFMQDHELESNEIKDMAKEILIGDFYRASLEWLKHNYDEDYWKYDLE